MRPADSKRRTTTLRVVILSNVLHEKNPGRAGVKYIERSGALFGRLCC